MMDGGASSRVILITGAAHGIGRATAEALLGEGWTVYGGDVDVTAMADLETRGMRALPMDVRDDEAVRAGVERILDERGRIDGLFANAGYCLLGAVELLPVDAVRDQLDVNVLGVGRAVRAVLPAMRARGRGTIVICSSAAGHVSLPGMAWYAATKHALQGLGDGLRMEVATHGVRVVLVEPGSVRTRLGDRSLPSLDLCARQPGAEAYEVALGRFRRRWVRAVEHGAAPETVARVVARAFRAERPRRRYRPHRDARMAVLARRLLGDALFDRLMTRRAFE